MKASLIWSQTDPKPSVAPILLDEMPQVQYLPEHPGINQGLRQLDREQPELVFFAMSRIRPDFSATLRAIRDRDPGCFVILFDDDRRQIAGQSKPDLTLPSAFSKKQLLDGVFQAELHRAGVDPTNAEPPKPEQTLPTPNDFLAELHQELYKFPDQVQSRHWKRLEQWMGQDHDAVGWHLVSLCTMMAEQMRTAEGCPQELETVYGECLRALSGGSSVPLWKGCYDKLCTLYISQLLAGGDPSGKQISRILHYIDEHIEDDVSLKRVAQEFYLSTSYLSRLFKSKVGVNFSDYISARKIERAKTLLTETDLTVAEISHRLNYPEQNSFSRFFKGKVGLPPQTYRTLNTGSPKERAAAPEPILEDFEITDFGPCAFTSEDHSFAYAFTRRQ